ncbi:MAG: helix-turn-helix domain-containing protein [Pseudomonadota bacterium]
MPLIVALVYPEALATSVTLPAEIIHAANQLARAQLPEAPQSQFLTVTTQDQKTVTFTSGLTLTATGSLDAISEADVLLLPAIWRHPRRVLQRVAPLFERIRQAYQNDALVCSVGTASGLLAEAGLLTHKAATTHWQDFDRFAARYPQVALKRRHLITQSDRIFCAGSVNSIADLMVYLLTQWYGTSVARAVEAQFSPEARQSFETAVFTQQSPENHHDSAVREVQDFLAHHLAEPHTLADLAGLAGLSTRSLSRRFKDATGTSPLAHLQMLRLREARELLQHTDLSLAEVSWRCGFRSASRFSASFRARNGLTPRGYRRAVRGKRFSALTSQP